MLASLAILLASCNCYNKMLKKVDRVSVSATPAVLTLKGSNVVTDVRVDFPAKYFNKKAVLKVTPVLVFEGGELVGTPKFIQGEKVKDNYTVIPYKTGGSYTQAVSFPYDERAKLSTLELRIESKCSKGCKKRKEFTPFAAIPVAEGVSTIQALADNAAYLSIMPDNFKRVTTISQNAEIMYLINKSNVRPGELTKDQVKMFEAFVKEYSDKDRATLGNVYAKGYASPDGPVKFNDELSKARSESGQKAISKTLESVNPKYDIAAYGEDWEGFKKAMEESNIRDKELILRVLAMYSDPEVREREIKNISSAYSVVAEQILPKLRRSKFVVNAERIGKSDEEIRNLAKSNPSALNVEELLYAATLFDNNGDKLAIYEAAMRQFPNDWRGFNDAGMILFETGKVAQAKADFEKANALSANNKTIKNNLGAVELINGNVKEAEVLFGAATGAGNEVNYNKGIVAIMKGDYKAAVDYFGKCNCVNAALANILAGNNNEAAKKLNEGKDDSALASYLKAVIAARNNDNSAVLSNLKTACSKDASMKKLAATDMEFAKLFDNADFQAIVK